MISTSPQKTAAAVAFDHLAAEYDAIFTDTCVGKAQRTAVWNCAHNIFTPSSRLLELNCGTGDDALHFAQQGFAITSCDVSPAMIAQARRKASQSPVGEHVRFYVQATESIADLPIHRPFAGAFSNFSGLNCVKDLDDLARSLAPMLLPGSPVLFCFSTRFCLWEIAWYLLHGDLSRCSRRWSGYRETTLGSVRFPVYYPTSRKISRSFAHSFRLVAIYGIGITTPPSYVEPWIAKHPALLKAFQRIDAAIHRLPIVNTLGDHMLLHLERLHT